MLAITRTTSPSTSDLYDQIDAALAGVMPRNSEDGHFVFDGTRLLLGGLDVESSATFGSTVKAQQFLLDYVHGDVTLSRRSGGNGATFGRTSSDFTLSLFRNQIAAGAIAIGAYEVETLDSAGGSIAASLIATKQNVNTAGAVDTYLEIGVMNAGTFAVVATVRGTGLTIASAATVEGTVHANATNRHGTVGVQLGYGNLGSGVRAVHPAASGQYNWELNFDFNVSNGFEITPSTVPDGTDFSAPVFSVTRAGAVRMSGYSAGTAKFDANGHLMSVPD